MSFYKMAMLLFFIALHSTSKAQQMTSEKLRNLIEQTADTLEQEGNTIRFVYNERILICFYDEKANRMRIVL